MALLPGGLCVSLTPSKLDDIFNSDLTGADMVEVRLDYLKDPQESLQFSWTRLSIPTIAVCRREERGGLFKGTVEEELQILRAAVRNGATAVDVDHRDVQPIGEAQVIASYHDFNGTPADLERPLKLACKSSAQIAKVATTVQSWDDNRRLLELMERRWPKPVIISGMGAMGQITRLIGLSRGSFLTYATTRQPSGKAAAPGQLTVHEMLDVYGFRRIQRYTKLIGILGNPLEHSLSPLLHNRAFRAAGLDFAYLKFPAVDVKDFFDNADSIGIHGLSITIPHKRMAIHYLPVVTDAAREVGAINTAVKSAGGWVGDNTDVDGVRAALAAVNFSPTDKRVAILGSGGAARAAVAAVRDASRISVLSRSKKMQESWPEKVEFDLLENAGKLQCDLLINATPIGMYPAIDASPIQGPIHADVVFDMVYNPPMTALLRAARTQGKTIIPGTTMFLAQAARQFEIWTGRTAPRGLFHAGDAGVMSRHSFRIPASTSNLGSGFDALGLALDPYLKITLEDAPAFTIEAHGVSAQSIPRGPECLILRVAQRVAAEKARRLPPFHMSIENGIPLARGLGSSAAAIVAGITCYELMTQDCLPDGEIFRLASEFEPHPDNLAAALYGGLIAAATVATGEVLVSRLKVALGVTPVVVIPEFELSTETARATLPRSYCRSDVIYNIQRSALTIAALTTGEWPLLREAMRDRIHQPFRAPLIPGLDEILELEMPGLLGVALSGAGPTVLAFAEPKDADAVGEAITAVFERHGVHAMPHKTAIDLKGRTIESCNFDRPAHSP